MSTNPRYIVLYQVVRSHLGEAVLCVADVDTLLFLMRQLLYLTAQGRFEVSLVVISPFSLWCCIAGLCALTDNSEGGIRGRTQAQFTQHRGESRSGRKQGGEYLVGALDDVLPPAVQTPLCGARTRV